MKICNYIKNIHMELNYIVMDGKHINLFKKFKNVNILNKYYLEQN